VKRFEARVVAPAQGSADAGSGASMRTLMLDAVDEADARQQVARMGFRLSTIKVERFRLDLGLGAKSSFSLVLFLQELLALLRAGLGIVEALEALSDKATEAQTKAVLVRMLMAVREGRRFSVALAEQAAVFPALLIGMIKASEGTSDLPHALSRYLEYRQRMDAVRSKVISASIYPVILLAVGGLVTIFLIAYVVPKFAEVYEGSGRQLPLLSQWMLLAGRAMAAHAATASALAVGALLVLVGGLRWLWRQGVIGSALLRIPGVGVRLRVFELARVYRTLGMLLSGGIPLVAALQTVDEILSTRWREKLAAARAQIIAGSSLCVAFERVGLTTPISLRLLAVGERSGSLGTMLEQSAAFHDGEIERWIDQFTRSFEPLLMAAIGLVVGVIVVMLYMPIFDLAGGLQ
jgi:general secretion pathway protein F